MEAPPRRPSLEDCTCPICLEIIVEPVTLPCNHELCMACFKEHLDKTSLVCPMCRSRISSWAREATRTKTLINQKRWDYIRQNYGRDVRRRAEDLNVSVSMTSISSFANFAEMQEEEHPGPILAEPGEIRREYEEEMRKIEEERRLEAERESELSTALILRLQEEEQGRTELDGETVAAQRVFALSHSRSIEKEVDRIMHEDEPSFLEPNPEETKKPLQPPDPDSPLVVHSNPDEIFGYEPSQKPEHTGIAYAKEDIEQFSKLVAENQQEVESVDSLLHQEQAMNPHGSTVMFHQSAESSDNNPPDSIGGGQSLNLQMDSQDYANDDNNGETEPDSTGPIQFLLPGKLREKSSASGSRPGSVLAEERNKEPGFVCSQEIENRRKTSGGESVGGVEAFLDPDIGTPAAGTPVNRSPLHFDLTCKESMSTDFDQVPTRNPSSLDSLAEETSVRFRPITTAPLTPPKRLEDGRPAPGHGQLVRIQPIKLPEPTSSRSSTASRESPARASSKGKSPEAEPMEITEDSASVEIIEAPVAGPKKESDELIEQMDESEKPPQEKPSKEPVDKEIEVSKRVGGSRSPTDSSNIQQEKPGKRAAREKTSRLKKEPAKKVARKTTKKTSGVSPSFPKTQDITGLEPELRTQTLNIESDPAQEPTPKPSPAKTRSSARKVRKTVDVTPKKQAVATKPLRKIKEKPKETKSENETSQTNESMESGVEKETKKKQPKRTQKKVAELIVPEEKSEENNTPKVETEKRTLKRNEKQALNEEVLSKRTRNASGKATATEQTTVPESEQEKSVKKRGTRRTQKSVQSSPATQGKKKTPVKKSSAVTTEPKNITKVQKPRSMRLRKTSERSETKASEPLKATANDCDVSTAIRQVKSRAPINPRYAVKAAEKQEPITPPPCSAKKKKAGTNVKKPRKAPPSKQKELTRTLEKEEKSVSKRNTRAAEEPKIPPPSAKPRASRSKNKRKSVETAETDEELAAALQKRFEMEARLRIDTEQEYRLRTRSRRTTGFYADTKA